MSDMTTPITPLGLGDALRIFKSALADDPLPTVDLLRVNEATAVIAIEYVRQEQAPTGPLVKKDSAIAPWSQRADADLWAEVERLREAGNFLCTVIEMCEVSDGMCCCGDDMTGHMDPVFCGHTPTDNGAYQASRAVRAWHAAIAATLPTQGEQADA